MTIHVIRVLWRLLDRRQRAWLIVLQLVSVLMALSTVTGVAAVLPFLSVLAAPEVIHRNVALSLVYERLHFGSEHAFVIALGVLFATVVALANAINFAGSLALYRFAYRVGDAFHLALFKEYLQRDYAFHSRTHSSVLAGNVIIQTRRVTSGILQSGLTLVSNTATVALVVASMALVDPQFAVSFLGALGACYVGVYMMVRNRLLRNGSTESRFFARRSKIVSESFASIKEIIGSQSQQLFFADFARCCPPISTSVVSTLAISQCPRPVLEIATVCSLVAAALVLGGSEGAAPWIARLSFMGLAAYRLLPGMQQAFAAMVRIRAEGTALKSIVTDLRVAQRRALRQAGGPAVDARRRAPWSAGLRGELCLEKVSYRHGANRRAAVSGVTLRIAVGSTVGLMGTNGSGKTTLADLLAGLLVPQEGRVQIDGITLDDANRNAWRSMVAYVPQQLVLLDATLAENVAFGVAAGEIDQPRLRDAIRRVGLDQCVAALPGRYEEMLGEGGGRLSGGQRQRLAIARALYRNASVLIMDEVMSALDPAAEQEIVDLLRSLARKHTVLLIAHRLASLKYCDQILEMHEGRIVRTSAYRTLAAVSP